jgi:hypothetical protein
MPKLKVNHGAAEPARITTPHTLFLVYPHRRVLVGMEWAKALVFLALLDRLYAVVFKPSDDWNRRDYVVS